MEARLVFVHGVENYLHGGVFEKVRLTDLSCFQNPTLAHAGTRWRVDPIYGELPRSHEHESLG